MADKPVEVAKPDTRRGFSAVFDISDAADAEIYRAANLCKNLGGASAKKIVELGVKAYMQSAEFKKAVELIKKQVV